MAKEQRKDLKGYFQSGDIPEAAHFESLIDSGINQEDDGLKKSLNTPLEIQAPREVSENDVIRLYKSFIPAEQVAPFWRISLSPAAANASAGLLIRDHDNSDQNKSYLFIQSGDGKIGIGTRLPGARLHVNGDSIFDGNVGIGVNTPTAKLEVNGTAKATVFEGNGAALTHLDASKITSGTVPAARLPREFSGLIRPTAGNKAGAGILFPSDPGGGSGDSAWIRYYAHPGTERTVLEIGVANDTAGSIHADHISLMPSGNVGIGTKTPAAKLDVDGTIKALAFEGGNAKFADVEAATIKSDGLTLSGNITGKSFSGLMKPTAGNTDSDGIIFPSDPGGGDGDKAWIRYYAMPIKQGSLERTVLEIGVANDTAGSIHADHISLMPSGNVGIGTREPGAKLEVNGAVIATSFTGSGNGLTNLNASNLTTGALPAALLPDMDASKIKTGILDSARLPTTISAQNITLSNGLTAAGDINGRSFSGLIKPTAGSSDSNGIIFPSDPGGGSGDKAWIRYYAHPGTERTVLEIGVANDSAGSIHADHISLMSTGNVGIGTLEPGAKLDVAGTVKATSFSGNGSGLTNLNAGNITTGTLPETLLPIMDASKIRTGILDSARLPSTISVQNLNLSNGLTAAGNISGSSFSGLIKPTAGSSDSSGIIFPSDPGRGSGDKAWIRYYARSGEATTLELGVTNDGDDHISLIPSGNVGIGTREPGAKLEVIGAGGSTVDISVNGRIRSGGTAGGLWVDANDKKFVGAIDSNRIGFWNNGNWRLIVDSDGKVGIGGTPSKGNLDISGGVTSRNTYGYLNASGRTGTTSDTQAYSIWADNRIACSEFNAVSDARIKQVAGQSDGRQDLITMMQLRISDYQMIDTIEHGTQAHKKVIGQQVREVFPQAVSLVTNTVPDIFEVARVEEGWIRLATDLKVGERVKLISAARTVISGVLEVAETGFRVAENITDKQVFVYGREVDDFHLVDYEAIAMLNVSATQELYRQLEELKRNLENNTELWTRQTPN